MPTAFKAVCDIDRGQTQRVEVTHLVAASQQVQGGRMLATMPSSKVMRVFGGLFWGGCSW